MPAPRSRVRAAITSALLFTVLVSASGCATPWTFGTTKWAASGEAYREGPRPLILVPFIVFDIVWFPVAIIHDNWPSTPHHPENARARRHRDAARQ